MKYRLDRSLLTGKNLPSSISISISRKEKKLRDELIKDINEIDENALFSLRKIIGY